MSADGADSVLTVEGLDVYHGRARVVEGADLTLAPGTVTGIVGVNGAGKSALANGIAGALRADGRVVLGSAAIESEAVWRRARRGLTLVQEGRVLFRERTVDENLELGAWRLKQDGDRVARLRATSFELFPVLERKRKALCTTLSGGEQQMLAIAQGLMSDPTVLILDEPMAGLSPLVVADVVAAIQQLAERGYTILVMDQSAALVLRVAQRIAVMRLRRLGPTEPAEDLSVDSLLDRISA